MRHSIGCSIYIVASLINASLIATTYSCFYIKLMFPPSQSICGSCDNFPYCSTFSIYPKMLKVTDEIPNLKTISQFKLNIIYIKLNISNVNHTRMMPLSLLQWLLFIHIFIICMTLQSVAKVPAIIVFGDSTVDTGNNNYIQTLAKSNFEPYGRDLQGGNATGRFSNGRLAVDFISEAFGLPNLVPAYLDLSYDIKELSRGVCFASAATGYDNATSDVFVSFTFT
jgi:GDSL-like Lipase/Acylhydrolase